MTASQEVYRKGLHLLALVIPMLLVTTSRTLTLALVALGALISWGLEWARLRSRVVNRAFTRMFRPLLRTEEARRITGATYMLVAAFMTILVFDVWIGRQDIAVTALLFVIVGDTVAALVGQTIGRVRIFSKTLEGTLGYFCACALLVVITNQVDLRIGLAGALAAAVTELIPSSRLNDNISVPLVSGGIMVLAAVLVERHAAAL